jgi:hypothetical protein
MTLTSSNYHIFREDFENHICALSYEEFITLTGNAAPPGPNASHETTMAFRQRNARCLEILKASCDTVNREFIYGCKTMKEALEKLENRYAGKYVQSKIYVFKDLVTFKWDVNKTATENANRYNACIATLSKMQKILPPDEQVFYFLFALPDSNEHWRTIKNQLMSVHDEDNLTLDQVVQAAIRCEQRIQHLAIPAQTSTTPIALISKTITKSNRFKSQYLGKKPINSALIARLLTKAAVMHAGSLTQT